MSTPRHCSLCGGAEDKRNGYTELRPYGKGGALVCFTCGTSSFHVETTNRVLGKMLSDAGPHVLLTADGPKPLRRVKA